MKDTNRMSIRLCGDELTIDAMVDVNGIAILIDRLNRMELLLKEAPLNIAATPADEPKSAQDLFEDDDHPF